MWNGNGLNTEKKKKQNWKKIGTKQKNSKITNVS